MLAALKFLPTLVRARKVQLGSDVAEVALVIWADLGAGSVPVAEIRRRLAKGGPFTAEAEQKLRHALAQLELLKVVTYESDEVIRTVDVLVLKG